MHQVKPLGSLTDHEIHELAMCAADRGERFEDVNPFTAGTHAHTQFDEAFRQRADELQPAS